MPARTHAAVAVHILPARPDDGPSTLHRLHAWLQQHAASSAAALLADAAAVRAACRLLRPARLTRLKQSIRTAVCRVGDVLHVEAAGEDDADAAIAGVVDGAGGLAYTRPPPGGGAPAAELPAHAKDTRCLLLHGLAVQEVLAGRHRLWSAQRQAGLLRPLPLSHTLEAVAERVDTSAMLPVLHACESPVMLAERFAMPERLVHVPRQDWHYVPTPGCPLCWRNAHLRQELGPGHVRATIPALYAAGYDAGHLLLRHAEHGLARAVTDLVRERRKRAAGEPRRQRKRARREWRGSLPCVVPLIGA
jgi:hypothetical protein